MEEFKPTVYLSYPSVLSPILTYSSHLFSSSSSLFLFFVISPFPPSPLFIILLYPRIPSNPPLKYTLVTLWSLLVFVFMRAAF